MAAAVLVGPDPQPTPTTRPERFVRVCPRHLLALQEHLVETTHGRIDVLTCPGPSPRPLPGPGRPLGSHRIHEAPLDQATPGWPHRVGGWATFDRLRGIVYGGGTRDRAIVREGELEEVLGLIVEPDAEPDAEPERSRTTALPLRSRAAARAASVRVALRYF